MSTTRTHDRNIAHEATAVEEGHRAYLAHDAQGWYVRIVSDTIHGKAWKVRALTSGPGCPIVFDCVADGTQRAGHRHISKVGTLPCKHAGLAARRLERAGLAAFVARHVDGDIVRPSRWVATDKVIDTDAVAELVDAKDPETYDDPAEDDARIDAMLAATGADDPFKGFPTF